MSEGVRTRMGEQLLGAVVLMVAVLGLGLGATVTLARSAGMDAYMSAGLVPLLGIGVVGTVTLVAGHAALLYPALPWILAAAGVVTTALLRERVQHLLVTLGVELRLAWRTFPLLITALAAALSLAFVAGLAAPVRTDEVEYHWPAPVAWAANGGWNASPYRHVNAFPFMEVVYTAAALTGSYVAAHWLHTLCLIALGLCTAGLARQFGVAMAVPVAAAAVVSPVVWLQSFAAYNDVAAAAFGVGAVAVLVSGRYTRTATMLSCILLAVSISMKPTSAATAGVIGLFVLLAAAWRTPPHPGSVAKSLRLWVPLIATSAVTLALWSLRQLIYTGNWLDPAMTAEPDAYARTMLPDTVDRLVWPLMPLVSGVLGSGEPWGGRTSLVIQALLVPALVYALWRGKDTLRRFLLFALPAYAHWMVLGLAIVRTRFHIVTFTMLIVAVAVVAEGLVQDRWARTVRLMWTGLVIVGLLDVLRQTLQMAASIR